MIEVTNKIYYVGVNDRNKDRFEGLWPLPNGVSYNSFLIVDKKVCLIDTVEVDFFVQFMEKLHDVLGDRKIDYLVINHMEPDHSGSLALIKKYYPDIQIVGNCKTFNMMKGFYNLEGSIEVKTGSTLDLGEHALRFILTPMVHWPETMMTVCVDRKGTTAVFSGDAFGSFGALNGGIIDSEIDMDAFHLETTRYYSNIVGKYGIPVQSALKKLAGLKIDYICSTHGPVWHEQVAQVMALYDRLSKYETDKGIVICYGTMYGNTERMAEIIARSASQNGIKNIVMYNVSKTDHSYILRDVFRFNGLIVGAPTYNAGLYHEMDVLLAELANKNIKNHYLGWFGSYCWASKAVAKIKQWNDLRLHFTPVGTPVDMIQGFSAATKKQCEALGKAMADQLNTLPDD
ncbi:MAG: FprA family A-type flavoprotein [Prevotella sp.]|jgi:flavorubredoxin|nr:MULTISPECIES: FprA family A-type flavoprotein [unclassified Prevotella]MCH3969570.1 FprA family A-type flavoprotein [Prevotella sp.]MCH3992856.1 FprA family A-type flavoprotein [Prevotella sp.]MCH4018956.1 FprA family A-type flavoprotein [Prevotella sp.]MCH4099436.1 FprA family A-type flavoprotein [Prevotella sp.]MCH4186425.1 FprA family A-type flavoprotein [Prevotella sp.]